MDGTLEIEVMTDVNEALSKLRDQPEAVARVLRWAADAYGVSIRQKSEPTENSAESSKGDVAEAVKFEDLAECFDAAKPSTDPERVLVVGYWLQEIEGRDSLDSYAINKRLTNFGYPAKNMPRAFDSLMNQEPKLAFRISKSGSSRQARKKYKITKEGVRKVKRMLAGGSEIEE